MEACATSHHWGRVAQRHGHEVRLVPAVYVKPFVKRQKADRADAEVPGLPGANFFESRRHGGIPSLGMIALFGLGGRDIPDRLEKGEQANAMCSREPANGIEPIDPLEGGELDRLEAAPKGRGAGSPPS